MYRISFVLAAAIVLFGSSVSTVDARSFIRSEHTVSNFECFEYSGDGECIHYAYTKAPTGRSFGAGTLFPHRNRLVERRYWEGMQKLESEPERVTIQRNARRNYWNYQYYWLRHGVDQKQHEGTENSQFVPYGNRPEQGNFQHSVFFRY